MSGFNRSHPIPANKLTKETMRGMEECVEPGAQLVFDEANFQRLIGCIAALIGHIKALEVEK